jgi:hypothetical protein
MAAVVPSEVLQFPASTTDRQPALGDSFLDGRCEAAVDLEDAPDLAVLEVGIFDLANRDIVSPRRDAVGEAVGKQRQWSFAHAYCSA